jgi:HlyD family secretion protein
VAFALAVVLGAGCSGGEAASDAYGNFEATEVLISSQATGKLLSFTAEEGETLPAGQVVGLVDTLQLALKRAQLTANRQAVRSKISGVVAQIEVLEEQKRVAQVEKARIEKLLEASAATQKQLDDVDGQLRVLDRQIQSIRTQNATILSEIEALDAQIAQLDDLIDKSVLVNPVAGTVLVTYAEPHELTAPGQPLYKIADLDTMELRAYVSGAQLPQVRLGQAVEVVIDADAKSTRSLPGTITWIAAQAEFTPKLIQTREERVNLVYAFKVRVANPDGALKIGMPGEVRFKE